MYTDGVDSSCPFPTRTLCFPCILKTGQSNHLLATLPSGHGSLVKPKASNMSYRADPSELHAFAKISSAVRVITPPKLFCCFEGPEDIDVGELKSMSFKLPAFGKGHMLGENVLLPVM